MYTTSTPAGERPGQAQAPTVSPREAVNLDALFKKYKEGDLRVRRTTNTPKRISKITPGQRGLKNDQQNIAAARAGGGLGYRSARNIVGLVHSAAENTTHKIVSDNHDEIRTREPRRGEDGGEFRQTYSHYNAPCPIAPTANTDRKPAH